MTTTTETKEVYFYQSTVPTRTRVDFSNPLHVELYNLIKEEEGGSGWYLSDPKSRARANRLMKKIGFTPMEDGDRLLWSSDLFLQKADLTADR